MDCSFHILICDLHYFNSFQMEVVELGLPLEPAMFPVVLVLKVALKLELVTTLHQHMVGATFQGSNSESAACMKSRPCIFG